MLTTTPFLGALVKTLVRFILSFFVLPELRKNHHSNDTRSYNFIVVLNFTLFKIKHAEFEVGPSPVPLYPVIKLTTVSGFFLLWCSCRPIQYII